MKYFPLIGFSSLALLTLAVTSKGATYTTNFDDFTSGNIHGQDGWVVDATTSAPPFNPGSVIPAGGNAPYGKRWVSIGYSTNLSQEDVYVSRTYAGSDATPLVGDVNATFSALFTLIDSDSDADPSLPPNDPLRAANAVRDNFGFQLKNASGYNLFSLTFTPKEQVSEPELYSNYDYISWSTGGTATEVWNGAQHIALKENDVFSLSITFAQGTGTDVNFTASIGATSFNGVIPNASAESIKTFGAFWDTSNAVNPGSNEMRFDNVSLVPEASTSLLGLLGASVALMRRRRI